MQVSLFNVQSVGKKSAAIQQWIIDMKLRLAALVKTWHDDATSPQLIVCAPPSFRCMENTQPHKDNSSTPTNHGGVCLMYKLMLCKWS